MLVAQRGTLLHCGYLDDPERITSLHLRRTEEATRTKQGSCIGQRRQMEVGRPEPKQCSLFIARSTFLCLPIENQNSCQ